MKRLPPLAALLLVALAQPAVSQDFGPAGKGSYVSLNVDAVGLSPGPLVTGSGLSLAWGSFQNRYFAAGTRVGFSRHPVNTFSLGGGPQVHIPLGSRLLLVPELDLAYLIRAGGGPMSMGFGINVGLSLAWRMKSFYAGIGAQAVMFDQLAPSFFPGPNTGRALFGFYY